MLASSTVLLIEMWLFLLLYFLNDTFSHSCVLNSAGVTISSYMMDPRSEERLILQEMGSATSSLKRSG